jgi:hypothetical protein
MNEWDLGAMLLTAVVNGAVTFGVVKTQLAWLRRDVDILFAMRDQLIARGFLTDGGNYGRQAKASSPRT